MIQVIAKLFDFIENGVYLLEEAILIWKKIYLISCSNPEGSWVLLNLRRQLSSSILSLVAHPLKLGLL